MKRFLLYRGGSTNAEWNESATALVCEPDIFSCDKVTCQADEYTDEYTDVVRWDIAGNENPREKCS